MAKIVAAAFQAGAAFTLFESVKASWARQMESCLRRHNSNSSLHKQEEQVEVFYHRGGVRVLLCTHMKVGGRAGSFGRYRGDNIYRVIYYVTDVIIYFWKHPLDEIYAVCGTPGSYIDKKTSTCFTSTQRASDKFVGIQLCGGTIPITRRWHVCR